MSDSETDSPSPLPSATSNPESEELLAAVEVVAQTAEEVEITSTTEVTTTIEADQFRKLAPAHVSLDQRISYVVFAVIALVIIGSTSPTLLMAGAYPWVIPLVLFGWLLLIALFVYFAHFWPAISHRHVRWRLTHDGLEIHRGVLWKHRIAIPSARVQHVDVSQGPFQRMLQLGKITIYTAGTKNASVELDGLEHEHALELRDQLVELKEARDVT